MDGRRRGRRGRRTYSAHPVIRHSFAPQCQKSWSILNGLYNFLVMSTLLALIYLTFDYQCKLCKGDGGDLRNITKNIHEMALNLSAMKQSYIDLEMKVSKISRDLPKLEGQIEVLESLAQSLGSVNCHGWDPETKRQYEVHNDLSPKSKTKKFNYSNCTCPSQKKCNYFERNFSRT